MRPWLWCAWLALTGMATAATAEDDAAVLKPTSDWVLDYANERCSFYRSFGNADDVVRLRIDSFGSPIDFRFLLAGSLVPILENPIGEMTIRFPPDSQEREIQSLHGRAGEEPAASFSANVLPYVDPRTFKRMSQAEREARTFQVYQPDTEFESGIDSVEVRFGTRRPFRSHWETWHAPLLRCGIVWTTCISLGDWTPPCKRTSRALQFQEQRLCVAFKRLFHRPWPGTVCTPTCPCVSRSMRTGM